MKRRMKHRRVMRLFTTVLLAIIAGATGSADDTTTLAERRLTQTVTRGCVAADQQIGRASCRAWV